MKLFVISALAVLSLAAVPQAAAIGPVLPDVGDAISLPSGCIIYPGTWYIGGTWVTVPGAYVPGQSRDVLFIHVQTDPVYTTPTKVWVPGTVVVTPGVCWDDAGSLLAALA